MLTILGFEAVNSLIGIAPALSIGKRARRMRIEKANAKRRYLI